MKDLSPLLSFFNRGVDFSANFLFEGVCNFFKENVLKSDHTPSVVGVFKFIKNWYDSQEDLSIECNLDHDININIPQAQTEVDLNHEILISPGESIVDVDHTAPLQSSFKDLKPLKSPEEILPDLELSIRTTPTGLKKVKNIGSWYDEVSEFIKTALLQSNQNSDINHNHIIKKILYLISSHDQSTSFVVEVKKICGDIRQSQLDDKKRLLLEIAELCKKQNLLEFSNIITKTVTRKLTTKGIHSAFDYPLDTEDMMDDFRNMRNNPSGKEWTRLHSIT